MCEMYSVLNGVNIFISYVTEEITGLESVLDVTSNLKKNQFFSFLLKMSSNKTIFFIK